MSKLPTTEGVTMTATLALTGPATVYQTRDEWLAAAVAAVRPLFHAAGVEVPAVRVSCGWPGGSGRKAGTIGQCWPTGLAADSVAQIFISPAVADREVVLATLIHELVHAVDDCKHGHGAEFRRLALAVGLTGKMTATVAGAELATYLPVLLGDLGAYPHGALRNGGARDKGRMRKCACRDCGCIVYTTAKWIDTYGAWDCPCGGTICPARAGR